MISYKEQIYIYHAFLIYLPSFMILMQINIYKFYFNHIFNILLSYFLLSFMIFFHRKLFANVSTFITNQYKFYIDFKGLLYFEQTKDFIYPNAIKDKKFITQLYQNLTYTNDFVKNLNNQDNSYKLKTSKVNSQSQNLSIDISQYPYMAQFWGQRNYIKCAIAPIIFNRVMKGNKIDIFQSKQSSEQFKQRQFLEFSLNQYSIYDRKLLRIDQQGRIWHPYLKIKFKKPTNQMIIEETKLWGIFSNELMSQMLQKLVFLQEQAYYQSVQESKKVLKVNFNKQTMRLSEVK